MESDGWYIDLPEFSCPVTFRPQVPPGPAGSSGGCRDDIKMRSTGGGKPGFALSETRTMSMGDAGMSFAISTETLEFSKATLDSALFDIPQGYSLTDNSQNLYGRPDVSAMMKSAGVGDDMDDASKRTAPANNPVGSYPSNMSGAKRPGTVRIGVYAPTNRSGDNVSISNLQSFLVQQLSSGNVEAIAIGSEPDARSANCDYVLSSDFSKLKQSTAGKIGGMFGKVTNTSVSGNYDAQVDYKLVSLSNGQTVLTNKAASKSETDVDRAAEGVLSQEAQSVIGQVRKN
jgi:hypothetical protein